MIVMTMMGGLGNQMFQYAFGRAASLALDRELILDVSAMPTGRSPHVRRWELPGLPIAPVRQLWNSGADRRPSQPRPVLRRTGRVARKVVSPWRVGDPPGDGVLLFSQIPSPVAICHGYWQSHRYFEGFSTSIRNELTPPSDFSGHGRTLMHRLKGREVIAVHVRRGDYVDDSRVAEVHGALNPRYHTRATHRIAEGLNRPVALVFSDDPNWALENLDLGIEMIHAEAEGPMSSIETLGLMARCHHHVIANSSFSWWGAYLGQHPTQRVSYPSRWFADRPINPLTRFPDHWKAFDAE